MPLTQYCTCGHPNLYTLEPPVFCAACGNKFGGSQQSQAKQNIRPIVKNIPVIPVIIPREKEDIDTYIDIDESKFNAEIEKIEGNNGIKFGAVASQKKTGFSRPKPKKVNVKQTVAQLQQEARPKPRYQTEPINDTGAE